MNVHLLDFRLLVGFQVQVVQILKHLHLHFLLSKFHHFLSFSSGIIVLEHEYFHLILNQELVDLVYENSLG